ncbi:MAG TPA: transposase, partial [Planctomycetota bacterium]|nr:transposase [Planctomycetota bacterium]
MSSLNEQGKVVHELRAPFKDGTTHFVFDPLVFIERLAALVPPPRMHQL